MREQHLQALREHLVVVVRVGVVLLKGNGDGSEDKEKGEVPRRHARNQSG
jgi:hypothetical protein